MSELTGQPEPEYGPEAVIKVPGGELRCPAYPEPCSYVRIRDDQGEFAYWISDEWRDDPEEVMGAIIGAAMGGRLAEIKRIEAEWNEWYRA